jgi:hypothetical protein
MLWFVDTGVSQNRLERHLLRSFWLDGRLSCTSNGSLGRKSEVREQRFGRCLQRLSQFRGHTPGQGRDLYPTLAERKANLHGQGQLLDQRRRTRSWLGQLAGTVSVDVFSRRRAMPAATKVELGSTRGNIVVKLANSSMERSIRAMECSGYWARYRCRTPSPGSKSMANALRTSSAVICGCIAITSSPCAQGAASGTQRPCHDACGRSSPISQGLC